MGNEINQTTALTTCAISAAEIGQMFLKDVQQNVRALSSVAVSAFLRIEDGNPEYQAVLDLAIKSGAIAVRLDEMLEKLEPMLANVVAAGWAGYRERNSQHS